MLLRNALMILVLVDLAGGQTVNKVQAPYKPPAAILTAAL